MRISNENYVDKAEQVIKELKVAKNTRGRDIKLVTTTQIRNILAMTADIYNDVLNENQEIISDETKSRIDYLRVRVLYEAGRDEVEGSVRTFIKKSELLEILKEIGNTKKDFILFQRYMEALVAFRKYYDFNDK